jgi:8-oxo-dGTP pyrophosphatase MutT (NUDIX family)
VYQNPWMKVREDSVVRPGGKDGIFGVVDMQDGVTVIALDQEGYVYLTHEYAYALGRHSLECVSGGIDEGESVLEAAQRELQEEVGGVSATWINLGVIEPFTSVIKSANYVYLAKDITIQHTQNTDEGEVIEVIRMPFAEVYDRVVSGEIVHGASVVAILKTHILLNQ